VRSSSNLSSTVYGNRSRAQTTIGFDGQGTSGDRVFPCNCQRRHSVGVSILQITTKHEQKHAITRSLAMLFIIFQSRFLRTIWTQFIINILSNAITNVSFGSYLFTRLRAGWHWDTRQRVYSEMMREAYEAYVFYSFLLAPWILRGGLPRARLEATSVRREGREHGRREQVFRKFWLALSVSWFPGCPSIQIPLQSHFFLKKTACCCKYIHQEHRSQWTSECSAKHIKSFPIYYHTAKPLHAIGYRIHLIQVDLRSSLNNCTVEGKRRETSEMASCCLWRSAEASWYGCTFLRRSTWFDFTALVLTMYSVEQKAKDWD
jgi:hypothetical protein